MWARASGIDSFKKLCSSASWDSQFLNEASWPSLPNPPITFQASTACEDPHLLVKLTKQTVNNGNLALADETNIIAIKSKNHKRWMRPNLKLGYLQLLRWHFYFQGATKCEDWDEIEMRWVVASSTKRHTSDFRVTHGGVSEILKRTTKIPKYYSWFNSFFMNECFYLYSPMNSNSNKKR